MSYTAPIEKKVRSKFAQKVNVKVGGYAPDVIYEDLVLEQELLGHHQFTFMWKYGPLTMSYRKQAEVIRKYLGSPVYITFKDEYGQGQVNFKGVITEMRLNDDRGGSEGFTVTGKSVTALLDETPQSRTFIKQSPQEVIKSIAQNVSNDLVTTKATRQNKLGLLQDYMVQYNETDYAFLQRMAIENGWWFYYSGEKLKIGELMRHAVTLYNGRNLYHFKARSRVQSQKAALTAYNYATAEAVEQNHSSYTRNTESDFSNNANYNSKNVYRRTNTHRQYMGGTLQPGLVEEKLARYQESQEANMVFYGGLSKDPLQLGGVAKIVKEGVTSVFAVVKAKHISNIYGHYECHFQSIPQRVKVPHYTRPFLVRQGESQPAVVTDNNDPQGLGRIKVKYFWGGHTPWIRLVQPHGGSGKGFYFIPEIGEEVMIAYEGGNVIKPYVLGTHYNGNALSGYVTPANDFKVIRTRSGHIIELNDTDKAESITITDKNKNIIFIDTANKNIKISAPETIDIEAKNINIRATERLYQQAQNMETQIEEDKIVGVGNNLEVVAESSYSLNTTEHSETIEDSKTVDIRNSLNMNSAEVEIIAGNGDVNIQGAGVTTVQGGQDVKVSKG